MIKLNTFITLLLPALLAASALSAQDFYGNYVQEVRVEMPYTNWDYKLDSLKQANPEARLLGNAWVNGQRFDSIGIRYKGNSSYFRTRNETFKKLPVNIKLDFKRKSQRLNGGYSSIKLSNGFLDPSFIRDPLAYEVVRKYMPAPLCNFARLYLNNRYFGLYINTESIDGTFIKKHFGASKGYMVKCDPDNWKRVRSQSGCPKGDNASLMYLNDNPGCYDAFYEVEDPATWKYLMQLIKVLNKTPEKIESVLDVDQTLWMLAINNAIVNLDSYNGALSHNYYLWFDSTGVAHPLMWDFNMAFGGWRRNFSFEEMKDEEMIAYQPLAEFENVRRPLISKLLRNPLYRKVYIAHLKTITQDFLTNGLLLKRADAMLREIDPYVKQDTIKLYGYTDFQNSMDKTMNSGPDHVIGIRQLMQKRGEYLSKHPLLNKTAPSIAELKYNQEGEKLRFTVRLGNAKSAWLMYRADKMFAFKRTPLLDDGANGDAVAGDGMYTVVIDAALVKHYYAVAESEEAALCFPERASFEYLRVE